MWPFKKKPIQETQNRVKLIVSQNGAPAIFGSPNDNVLTNDVVIQCIAAIARDIKKLLPKHVKEVDGKKVVVNDSINKILRRPNRNMTISDFLEAVIWQLYGRDNCFIYPVYEIKEDANGTYKRIYSEMYILMPTFTEFYVDDMDNVIDVKFTFGNGQTITLNYQKIIHLKRNFGLNDLMGGDKYGRPHNESLIKTTKLSEALLEGVNRGAIASQTIQGVMKYNVLLDNGEMKNNIDQFNQMLAQSKSGIVGLDLAGEYVPVTRDVKLVDAETIEYADKKIARNFGVSQQILDGIATADEKRAFYDTTLEPIVVSLNQAFTNNLFTDGEINRGHEIKFYHNIMETFSIEEQFEHYKELMDRGAMTPNEVRDRIGLPPMENGDEAIMSLNYVKKNDASTYQLGKAGADISESGSEEEGSENEPEL